MINEKVLCELRKNKRSSFAIWEVNPNNEKDVSETSFFKNIDVKFLKPNIIFVAMNMADDSTIGKPLSNFHSSIMRHNDYRLAESICDKSLNGMFEGAYMYDLFNRQTPSSEELKQYYKENPNDKKNDIENFINHCRYINQPMNGYITETTIFAPQITRKYVICIGSSYHYEELQIYFSENKSKLSDFLLCNSIFHHSARNRQYTKDEQVKKLIKVKKQINQ